MSIAAEDTIAAIATPPGPGGIGVIRISGPAASAILSSLFVPHKKNTKVTSHRMIYGWIVDPAARTPIDEVMVVYMQAPNTYTREDVVEIQCHGSYLVLQTILDLILGQGARLAPPGEFTKRAYLNGRIDLTRAEAVIELLQARTREGMQLAVSQLQGQLSGRIGAIREALIAVRAVIEVAIDFPEDDVEIMAPEQMLVNLAQQVIAPLSELIAAADRGKIFREGISVVILGRPNVGKSSLLNSLLQEDRAIVTDIPGTTRDIIEEYLDIKGMPVRIIDTAGIRDTAEHVEEIGIQKARQKQEDADLVLVLIDASESPGEEDRALCDSVNDKPALLVLNKIDLAVDVALERYAALLPLAPMVSISAKTRQGLADLEEQIFRLVAGSTGQWDPGHDCVPNLRHRAALARALTSSQQVVQAITAKVPADLVAIDLQTALDELGDIIGATTTEDVRDMIFDNSCIGK